MFKKTLVLWFLFFSATVTFLVFLWMSGVIKKITDNDYTNITLGIIGVYLVASLYCGKTILGYVKSGVMKTGGNFLDKHGNLLVNNKLKSPVEIGYFMAEILMSAGMVGTVWGMLDALMSNLPMLDVSDVGAMKQAMSGISKNVASALITTFGGLVCSMLLKCQFMGLDKATDA